MSITHRCDQLPFTHERSRNLNARPLIIGTALQSRRSRTICVRDEMDTSHTRTSQFATSSITASKERPQRSSARPGFTSTSTPAHVCGRTQPAELVAETKKPVRIRLSPPEANSNVRNTSVSSAELKDGFSCPKEIQTDSRGQAVAHPMYPHPEDCQKFYVCLNGVTPREQGCSLGQVYNEDTGKCDEPENVPGW